jgi:hypothetical protein
MSRHNLIRRRFDVEPFTPAVFGTTDRQLHDIGLPAVGQRLGGVYGLGSSPRWLESAHAARAGAHCS